MEDQSSSFFVNPDDKRNQLIKYTKCIKEGIISNPTTKYNFDV